MRVDPQVTKRKFQREVDLLKDREKFLRKKRCWVVGKEFPYVDALLFPLNGVILETTTLVPDPQGPYFLPDGRYNTGVVRSAYPYLACRPMGVRLEFSDFDQRPPSVSFHDPLTGVRLPFDQIPPAIANVSGVGPRTVVLDGHPETGSPFMCRRYVREYHEHPQHKDDPWVWYRKHFSLPNLLEEIANTFTAPVPVVASKFPPQTKPFGIAKE